MFSIVNGEVVTLVPGKLLLFQAPDDATVSSAGRHDYVDLDGRRHFSSAFYAALLADLGAALIISFDPDRSECSHTAAYAAEGLAYYPLRTLCGLGGGASLQSLDRFIALAAAAPGPVAVQWHSGQTASDVTATHLAALLMRHHNFATAGQALAWIRMVRPADPACPAALHVLDFETTQFKAEEQLRRSLSACARTESFQPAATAASVPSEPCSASLFSGATPSFPPPPPPAASDPAFTWPAAGGLGRAFSSPGEPSE